VYDGTHLLAKIGLYCYELEYHWFGLDDLFLFWTYNVQWQDF
jgi:hypothetical protein